MKQAILFLSNKSNDWTLRAFRTLEQSMQMNADVYFVYHQQGDELPVSLQTIQNLFPFTSSILQNLGYTPIEEGRLVPGSNHFPLLKFFKEHQEYDYYWMVEDDVRFSGDWKVFFNNFSTNHADFLASIIESKKENPNWFWWSYLKTENENVSEEQLLKSFNPIYRLSHQALLCIDEYFFLMDDDIEMSTEEVNKLFRMMREYNLKIAQPSLVMSYYTYEHTLHNPLCILRYTNFVEMMVPCFSREALIKVLPTFEKKVRGCGIEFHWPILINTNRQDMAIIDLVHAKHVRPLQPWDCQQEMDKYLAEHHIDALISIFSRQAVAGKEALLANYDNEKEKIEKQVKQILKMSVAGLEKSEMIPLISMTYKYANISEKRYYLDVSTRATEVIVGNLSEALAWDMKDEVCTPMMIKMKKCIKECDAFLIHYNININ